ncbi:MAG: DNA-processing protein DprA [Alphaproteobacteria bacterium]|nr:DNA-processing protein DprA [Alphaproteobacteria bacterium]
MSDLFEKLLLFRMPGVGAAKYAKLIQKFGSVRAVLQYIDVPDKLKDDVLREMERAERLNIHYIADEDDMYPQNLKQLPNHPPVVTVRGNLGVLSRPMVGMVGTRHATAAGQQLIAEIAESFAGHGYAVVSGMAIGTDTAAHRGALRASGNVQTIAVLAGGVDYIWPVENESLYYQILERGAVISEMPVGFEPRTTNFVQRNRWIAGLSEKLILGEADMQSGSMTTARFATEYGREVWAIPSHPLDPRALGPNSLIRSGDAKLCIGVQDFFCDDKKEKNNKKIITKNDSENVLIDNLGNIPVSESVLAEIVKKSVSEIKSELVVLELQGLVRKVDGGYVKI